MKTLLFHNTKGGIGKTTITKAIAEILAFNSKKILIIDADGQGSISSKFGITDISKSENWFKRQNKENIENYIKNFLPNTIEKTNNSNIDIVSGGRELYLSINTIETQPAAEKGLATNLFLFNKYFKKYDYVFIDLNPSWDILTKNSYLAADSIISIIDRTEDAINALIKNMKEWDEIADAYGIKNNFKGVILNRIKSDKMSKEILKACNVDFLKNKKIESFIPESANVEKSVVTGGKSVIDVKTFDNWKPSKAFAKWLNDNGIKYKEGNPFKNLIDEMIEKEIL